MRKLDKRLRELEEAAGVVQRRVLDAGQLRRLVRNHWNPAFGEATPQGVETWVASLEALLESDIASGTPPGDAVARVEALVAVVGRMTTEEIAKAMIDEQDVSSV